MMDFEVTADQLSNIDFAPASELKEILQNVRTIISTVKCSVPLDRDFGVDAAYLDMPMPVAKAKASSEIIRAIRKYEPRVEVTKITWDGELDGVLKPKVQVTLNE